MRTRIAGRRDRAGHKFWLVVILGMLPWPITLGASPPGLNGPGTRAVFDALPSELETAVQPRQR